ncbi:hypothetical protein D3C73_1584760 [compost metagenome]
MRIDLILQRLNIGFLLPQFHVHLANLQIRYRLHLIIQLVHHLIEAVVQLLKFVLALPNLCTSRVITL